ncbi:MAG: sugar ABC transporter substrate-binding protein [bacterium]|nr:sugar ABC transporter substrate-binding protein [bacterium]
MVVITVNNGPREGDKLAEEETRVYLALFNKKYPNIKVKMSSWQFTPETFLTKMAGGTCTDVVGMFATEGIGVAEKNLALDLTDRIRTWENYPDLNPAILAPYTVNGRYYGLPAGPYSGYIMGLFYNKKLFKSAGIVDSTGEPKPPETWDEFVQTAVKLTDRKKNISGFGICAATGAAGWYFLNWVWQAGGDFEQKQGNKWIAVFNAPPAVHALQFIKDLRWKYDVLQPNFLIDSEEAFKLFASDQIAMAMMTPEWIPILVEKYGMDINNIGVTILPAGPAGRANQMGGGYAIINPTISREKQDACWKYITFAHDTAAFEQITKLRKEQGRIVGIPQLCAYQGERKEIFDRILDTYRNIPLYERFRTEANKYVKAEPPFFCQQLYSEALSPAVQSVLSNKNADPKKLLDTAATQFQTRFLDTIKSHE